MSSFQQNVIKHKLGLLNLAIELGNVSHTCNMMVFSRDTFYRYQSAVETAGDHHFRSGTAGFCPGSCFQ